MSWFSAHLGYLFNEVPLRERFAAARAAGFSRVEVPNPYVFTASELRALCDENGLQLVQIGSSPGNPAASEKGIACLADRVAEFDRSIAADIAYAREAGAQFLHVLAGIVPTGETREALWGLYVRNLGRACALAEAGGPAILIEPIGPGTIADYMMDDPFDALRALEAVGAANLSILFDTFHTANAGIDPVQFVRDHGSRIGHIHVADHPGRHEPGTGRIAFAAFVTELKRQNYPGSIGLEYVPATHTVAGLGWRDNFGQDAERRD